MKDLSILSDIDPRKIIAELRARAQPPALHYDDLDAPRGMHAELTPFTRRTLMAALMIRLRAPMRTIYGRNDWLDHFEAPSARLPMFECTAAVFTRNALEPAEDDSHEAIWRPFGEVKDLCSTTLYWTQPMAAAATGVLIAPDRLVTAAHVLDQIPLHDMRFVFGFRMDDHFKPRVRFAADEVYRAVEVLGRGRPKHAKEQDWAVLRLDRETRDRPIPVIASAAPLPEQPVYTIGHPMGLPGKHAGGASVLTSGPGPTFTADLDIFPLCSGSPVFRADDALAGIVLSEPGEHFLPEGACNIFAVYQDGPGNTHLCASVFARFAQHTTQ